MTNTGQEAYVWSTNDNSVRTEAAKEIHCVSTPNLKDSNPLY